jgi:hypothetical protein
MEWRKGWKVLLKCPHGQTVTIPLEILTRVILTTAVVIGSRATACLTQ